MQTTLYQETSAQSLVDACVLENALQLDAVHALERDGQVDVAMSWSVVAIVPNVVVVPKSGTGQGFHVLRGDGNIESVTWPRAFTVGRIRCTFPAQWFFTIKTDSSKCARLPGVQLWKF